MYDIESLLKNATLKLKNAPKLQSLDIRARFESEILLAFTLNVPRVYLHTHSLESVSKYHKARFMRLIARRAKAEPIEYITHKASFYGNEFFVNNAVLIPRADSEILIDVASQFIKSHHISRIVEVGVGSGILSITLALLHSHTTFLATDMSLKALKIARKNIATFGCQKRIRLLHSDILESMPKDILAFAPELIISNPPYIAKNYTLPLPLEYEPAIALFSGEDGLDIIRRLITQSQTLQIPLVCEMGYHQQKKIAQILQEKHFANIEFFKDLSGKWRVFLANPKANY